MDRFSGIDARTGPLPYNTWQCQSIYYPNGFPNAVRAMCLDGRNGIGPPYSTLPNVDRRIDIDRGISYPIQQSPSNGGIPLKAISSTRPTQPTAEPFLPVSMRTNNATHANHGMSGRPWDGIKDGFAYYLDRGNGELTRLIPADVLPPLNEIPPRECEATGMVVLPPLRTGPQNGNAQMNHPVTVKTWQYHDSSRTSDSLQKHIDRIITTSPTTAKKIKIYCDKWIHEGVCAFTQQGCKYKHEMPFDELTQRSLGLFQGFPTWWKKRQDEMKTVSRRGVLETPRARGSQQRLAESLIPLSPVSSVGKEAIWQSSETSKTHGFSDPPLMQNLKQIDASRRPTTKCQVAPFSWGPIGPPRKAVPDAGCWNSNNEKRTPENSSPVNGCLSK